MSIGSKQTEVLKKGTRGDAPALPASDREQILKPYLPPPRAPTSPAQCAPHREAQPAKRPTKHRPYRRHSIRDFIASLLYKIVFHAIQLVFSIYIYVRQTYHGIVFRALAILHYHHRSPEIIQRDLRGLSRLPRHMSIIVDLQGSTDAQGYAESVAELIGSVAELAAWCTCAGIPTLSIYERSGVLKTHIPSIYAELRTTLASYYPPSSLPSIQVRVPHLPAYSASEGPAENVHKSSHSSLEILLLSSSDGRGTIVDLTKTLAEMAQRGKIQPSDVTTDLIDAEITDGTCAEPDLVVVMAPSPYKEMRNGAKRKSKTGGRRKSQMVKDAAGLSEDEGLQTNTSVAGGAVCLRGYPPWQARLTELFYVQDSSGVEYGLFLRALHRYAKAEFRFGT